MQKFPILTLWAIWTWLSIEVLSPITVSVREPLSIVQKEPIITSFSIITLPIWGNLNLFFFSKLNPNPVWPIKVPDFIITLSPSRAFSIITFDPIIQFLPIWTFCLIITLLPVLVPFPILALISIRVLSPIKLFFFKKTFLFFWITIFSSSLDDSG